MPLSLANDPRHWKKRAEELRDEAERMRDGTAKDAVLSLAATYDGLADQASERVLSAWYGDRRQTKAG